MEQNSQRVQLPVLNKTSADHAAAVIRDSRRSRIIVHIFAVLSILLILPAIPPIICTGCILNLCQHILYHGTRGINLTDFDMPQKDILPDGRVRFSSVPYHSKYPNGVLDITLPGSNTGCPRPVVLYLHAGGWIYGSRRDDDPRLYAGYRNLFRHINEAGYAVVSADYALAPKYRFPVPVLQLNEVIAFLKENASLYGLDMSRLVIMGSSAGATTAAQFAAACADPAYAKQLKLDPVISAKEISALVINEAPMAYGRQALDIAFVTAHYLKGTLFIPPHLVRRFNPANHITADYPPTYLLASDVIRKDMHILKAALQKRGVENVLYDPRERHDQHSIHCYLAMVDEDKIAQEAFLEIIDFLDAHTK